MKIKSAVIGLVLAALIVPASDAEARRTGKVRTETIDMVVIHSTGGPTCDVMTGKPIWVKAGTLEEDMRDIEANPEIVFAITDWSPERKFLGPFRDVFSG